MTPMSVHGDDVITADRHEVEPQPKPRESTLDVYFSADVETDGPIPGPFSMLSFALVYAGAYDGNKFVKHRHARPIVPGAVDRSMSSSRQPPSPAGGDNQSRLCL